jgi:endo-1,4-beta-D-glucanase Y
MSYGMMVTVQLDQQRQFDALFGWAKKNMQHTDQSDPRYGYFSWHCGIDGSKKDQNPASDGETWFVTALYFASHRWGNSGRFNYRAEADLIIEAAATKESGGKVVDSVVDMWSPVNHQVVFTPYASAAAYTDPSYHLPSFYRVWAVNARAKKRWLY